MTNDNARKSILVVDDDPDIVLLVSGWLDASGYQTETAVDAMTCIQSARRSRPDAIILDLGLPAGGGLVALERLKRNTATATIPVVVLTARDTATARAEAEKRGAFAFVPKQGNKSFLLETVSTALGEQDQRDSF